MRALTCTLLAGLALPLSAVDSLKDTTLPLLFRPGLPQGHGSVILFYDHTAAAGVDHDDFADEDYEQQDYGALAVGNLLKGESWIVRGYAGARQRNLGGDIEFDSGLELPDRIEQIAIGTSGKRQFGMQGAMTWRLGLNSTSDKPFNSWDEIGIEAEVFYMGYRENRDAWMVGAIYSSFADYPVPTASYIWNVNEQLTLNIGLPVVGLRWKPAERWQVSGSAAAIIDDASLSIARGFGEQGKAGDQFEVAAKIYRDTWTTRPVDREDRDYSLSFKEWRLGLGATWRFGLLGALEAESGWAFNRKIREEEQAHIFDDGDYTSIRAIRNTWYVRAKCTLRF